MADYLIDQEDSDRIAKYQWYFDGRYWRRTLDGMLMHEFLMGKAPAGMIWDHVDRNKGNNKRSNLRPCTPSQSNMNKDKWRGEYTSRYKGVYRHTKTRKWVAQIKVDRKLIYLGIFASEEDAARAYDKATEIYFGEFAVRNLS
jgi:hypothetical protein